MSHQHSHVQPQQLSIPPIPKELPKDVAVISEYLLSTASELKLRKGVMNGQKFEFFKGKHAVNALNRESYGKRNEQVKINGRKDGEEMMQKLVDLGMIVKVQKEDNSLTLAPDLVFKADEFYVWIYQGSQLYGRLMGVGVLIIVFIGVLFPLWPQFMRQGVYYLSLLMIGFLGFLMVLGVVRWIIYIVLILVIGRGGWLFPNLFADVGFFESFQPVWVWNKKSKKVKKE